MSTSSTKIQSFLNKNREVNLNDRLNETTQ